MLCAFLEITEALKFKKTPGGGITCFQMTIICIKDLELLQYSDRPETIFLKKLIFIKMLFIQ